MKAQDVQLAVSQTNEKNAILNMALSQILPVLRRLAEKGKWWQRWGMDALINAVEMYLRGVGYTIPTV